MTQFDVGEWTIEEENEQHISLVSAKGAVIANRIKSESSIQTWAIDASIEGSEPMSWRVQVSNRTNILDSIIPEILNEELP